MMISQEVVQIIFYLFNVHCNTYRQWVAVRMKLGEIRDPPQMCLVVPPGSFSWTDTCHGQCPGTASLPPTIKPTWEEPTILCPQPESQVHLNISKWQTLQSPKMPTKMTFPTTLADMSTEKIYHDHVQIKLLPLGSHLTATAMPFGQSELKQRKRRNRDQCSFFIYLLVSK